MKNKVSYNANDVVEIVELINKETKRPIMTIFIVNRKFGNAYEHIMRANKAIDFVGEYVRCNTPHIAAGYELATAQHGRQIDVSKIPAELRLSIMNCLPEQQCTSTPSKTESMNGSPMFSLNSSTTKNSPLEGQVKAHTSTENGSK